MISPSLNLSPTSLSGGTVGIAYSATITASGGPSPTFAVTSGSLPNGLSLATSGALTGTPTTVGTFNFTITATSGSITGSRAHSIIIAQGSSSTSLVASPSTVVVGDTVTLTATVTTGATGTVTFKDGGTTLGTATLNSNTATFTTTGLTVGTHSSLTAVYGGDTNYAGSTSSAQTVTVNKISTTTSIVASPSPATFAQTVTLTATVTSSSATGTITFKDGSTPLATVTLSGGTASTTVSNLTVGAHTITADYSGDASYAISSGSTSLTINKINTSTNLTVSNANPTVGSSITFTATVSPSSTGSVVFKDGTTVLDTISLNGSSIATFSTTALSVGSHTVTAEYQGDSTHNGSTSNSVGVNVAKLATTTTLVANPTTADVGSNVTLTATVSPTATGNVIFKDGTTTLGTVALNGSSVATYTTNALTVGSHSITAAYQGDSTHDPSTSTPTTVTVNVIATTTTLSASATTIAYPSSVTLVATVAPSNSTGSVTFKDGSTVLGTVSLSSGSATLTVNSLTPGSHSITATYSGDPTHGASTSSAVVVTSKRPDPTLDPNVRGILSSQVQAVQRFAGAQIGNVQQRLEQLHSDDVAPVTFGMGFVALDQSCRASLDPACTASNSSQKPMAYAAQDANGTKIFSAFDKQEANAAPMPVGNPREYSTISIWSAGTVMFGHENLMGQPGDNRFTASGLSVGFDTRVRPGLKMGAAFGFGSDRTDIGNSFAFNRGNSVSGTFYASWRLFGGVFLDGLVGLGNANFTSGRPSPFDNGWITGNRDARMTYGSVILTSEHRFDQLKLAPYTRLDMIHANLKAYTEQGPADWVLSYGDASKTSTSAVIGLRAQYDWLIGNGNIISPIMRVEYAHLFGGGVTQSLFYATDPSTQYGISLAPSATNTVSGSFGVKATGGNGVSGQIEYLLSGSTEGGVRGQGVRGLFRVSF